MKQARKLILIFSVWSTLEEGFSKDGPQHGSRLQLAKCNFGVTKQTGKTNWLDKSDKKVFVNFTRKLKEKRRAVNLLAACLGAIPHFMLLVVYWPVWNPWQANAQFFFLTFIVTRQEIIQFTCHASVNTVTLHTFFHLENHISM